MEGADVGIGGAAAASEDIHKAFVEEGADVLRHTLGRLVVLAKLVGQSGVRVGAYINRFACVRIMAIYDGPKLAQGREHILSSERTIESDAEERGVAYRDEEGFEVLA